MISIDKNSILYIFPNEIIENLLACHHFGHICAIETVNAIRAHETFLILKHGAFLCKHVSNFVVDAKPFQIFLINALEQVLKRLGSIFGCSVPWEIIVANLLSVLGKFSL